MIDGPATVSPLVAEIRAAVEAAGGDPDSVWRDRPYIDRHDAEINAASDRAEARRYYGTD